MLTQLDGLTFLQCDATEARKVLKCLCMFAMYGMRRLYNRVAPLLCLCRHLSDAASKHAAQAFFDCLRAEVAEYGIIVSTISHTFINASDEPPEEENAPKPNTLTACKSTNQGLKGRRVTR